MKLKGLAHLRIAVVCLWLMILALAIAIAGPGNIIAYYTHITPQAIRDHVSAFGSLAVFAFLAASLVRPLFFLPVTPFTVASGFLFGFWQGMIWSFAGTTLSAMLAFFVSRYLLRDYVTGFFSARIRHIDKSLESGGWRHVLFVRLIPMVPFDWVGFAAGASSVSFRDYMIGTVLGEMPGALILVMLGSSLVEIGSATFYVSLILALVVLIGPAVVRHWMKNRKERLAQ